MSVDLMAIAFANAFSKSEDPLEVTYGVVASVDGPTVSVRLRGSTEATANIKSLDSYVPVVGDVVLCVSRKFDTVILGSLADTRTKTQDGEVEIAMAANSNGYVDVDFPIDMAAVPRVRVNAQATYPAEVAACVSSTTATSCRIRWQNTSANSYSAVVVTWLAIVAP